MWTIERFIEKGKNGSKFKNNFDSCLKYFNTILPIAESKTTNAS